MKTYYYYQSLRKTIIQFLDIFNDIRIARYESDGATVRGYLTVPLKFAPKTKAWYWINERKYDEILPIMSATMQSCEFATDRVVNKDMKIIKTIVELGKNLELKVVVEGVEERKELEFLKGIGVNIFQGYYFGRPERLEVVLDKLKNGTYLINLKDE